MMPAARRAAALRLVAEHGLSQRRACRLTGIDPKTVRRQPVADGAGGAATAVRTGRPAPALRLPAAGHRSAAGGRADMFDNIGRFYNSRQRHSTLGYLSPMAFEMQTTLA